MFCKRFVALLLVAAPICIASPLSISVTGPDDGVAYLSFAAVIGSSWTYTVTHIGVGLDIRMVGSDNSGFENTAYITTSIGPGTTTANEIARQNFTVDSATPTDVLLFAGLTLDSGTYYLTLFGRLVGWQLAEPTNVVSNDPYASILSDTNYFYDISFITGYPPATPFYTSAPLGRAGEYSVTAVAIAPELDTLYLSSINVLLLLIAGCRQTTCQGLRTFRDSGFTSDGLFVGSDPDTHTKDYALTIMACCRRLLL